MIGYAVLRDTTIIKLRQKIKEHYDNGWRLYGNIKIKHGLFCQVMKLIEN